MFKLKSTKIGILGGSFDPVHKGHLKISKIALKKIKLKKIYWVVTKKNPFKEKTFFSLKDRIDKAKKISSKIKNIEVLYIDDVINAIENCCSKPAEINTLFDKSKPESDSSFLPYRIFNVGNNKPVELMDYIHAIEKALKKKAIINFIRKKITL